MNTQQLKLSLTKHAKKQATEKGFTISDILSMWHSPEARAIRSRSYPGQYRVCGDGICLVGVQKNKRFIVITCYADQELTPPRPDQLRTGRGRRYARRFAEGEGRG